MILQHILMILYLLVFPVNSKIPTIAILSAPEPAKQRPIKATRISNNYVKWIGASGGRVVAMHVWQSDEEIIKILESVNGVLIQGGKEPVDKNDIYTQKVNLIINKAKEINDSGKVFPILGSCLGFEFLIMNELPDQNKEDIFSRVDVGPTIRRVEFSDIDVEGSQLMKYVSLSDKESMRNEDILTRFHYYAMLPYTYNQLDKIKETYKAISYSTDKNKIDYIIAIEGKKYPFFGVNYHMEKTVFHINEGESVSGSVQAIIAARSLGNGFIEKARENPNVITQENVEKNFDYINELETFPIKKEIGLVYYYEHPRFARINKLKHSSL